MQNFAHTNNDAFAKAEEFLYALRNAGSKYSLDRMLKFSEATGNAHLKYPVIHVAGTNGKGSVCAMTESILRECGLKVGMFTSPHLIYLGERIQINRNPIKKDALISYSERLRKVADKIFDASDPRNYPSFFEFMTLAAFRYFADEKVDAAVVEVGLGGRLDSTNIVSPDICAITSIGLDHTALLGNTLAQIAKEKAGIIKDGVPVVCGFLPEEAMEVVRTVAQSRNAPLYCAQDFYPTVESMPTPRLNGLYQRRNAAIAALIAQVLKLRSKNKIFGAIDDSKILGGLAKVSWAARWEDYRLPNGARLILDSSHNEEGARSLEENLAALSQKGVRPVVALGVLGRERAVPLLSVVAKYAREIVFLVPDQPRALSFEELHDCMPQMSHDIKISHSTVRKFYAEGEYEKFVSPSETLVSTGSIYLAGEVLAALTGKIADSLQDRP